jgi:hypothetical protein
MGELDLEAPLGRGRALAEYLEDEAGAVDHLDLRRGLQILLLDRRDRGVDDEQLGLPFRDRLGDQLGLALAEQRRRARAADAEMELVDDLDADRFGKPRRLVEARRDVAPRGRAEIGQRDDGAGAAGEVRFRAPVEAGAQAPSSSSPASTRLSGLRGCTVEIACL